MGNILVADDSDEDVWFLNHAFKKAELLHSIQSVRDGEDAIAYLEGGPPYSDREKYPLPQLLFLDLKMPRTDGFGVLRWLKTKPQFAQLPVVVLSSSNLDSDITTALRLGAKDFRTKPNRPDELMRIVTDVCERWLKCYSSCGCAHEK